jgi:hypothetical protein
LIGSVCWAFSHGKHIGSRNGFDALANSSVDAELTGPPPGGPIPAFL